MKRRMAAWFFALAILPGARAHAQNINEAFTPFVNAWDLRDLTYDPVRGVFWIASNGGALRFDLATESWTHYPKLLGTGPRGNDLTAVCLDPDGNVWVGSGTRGFTFFDPEAGRWDRIVEDWPDPRIRAVRCLNGGLYVGTQAGLALKPTPTRTDICNEVDAGCIVPSYIVNDFAFVGDTLWVATQEGLGRRSDTTWDSTSALPAGSAGQESRSLAVFEGVLWEASNGPVRRLVDGTWQSTGLTAERLVVTGGALHAILDFRVYRWNGADWVDLATPHVPLYDVHDVERIGDTLWLATAGGLYRWPEGSTTATRFTPPGPGIAAPVVGLDIDAEGTVWAGTQAGPIGLMYYDGADWALLTPHDSGLQDGWIFPVLVDEAQTVFAGHCCCFRPQDLPLCRLDILQNLVFSNLPVYNSFDLAQDAAGRIWVGQDQLGATVIEQNGGVWQVALTLTNASTGGALATNFVRAIAVTSGGTYFGHLTDGGVSYWPHGGNLANGANGTGWIHINDSGFGLLDNNVNEIEVVGEDLWVGTASGVHRLRDGAVQERCLTKLRDVSSDPVRKVNTIVVDFQGGLWVGTDDGILYLPRGRSCDVSGGDFTIFTESNSPLPNNQVLSAAVSPDDGSVWFGTHDGLLRVDPQEFSTTEPPPDQYVLYPNPLDLRPGTSQTDREVVLGLQVAGLLVEPAAPDAVTRPEVFDLSGRKVADFDAIFGQRWGWKGQNRNGNFVAPGIYVVRSATADGDVLEWKLGVLR